MRYNDDDGHGYDDRDDGNGDDGDDDNEDDEEREELAKESSLALVGKY